MKKWLEDNPNKSRRDWLIEECCVSDKQKQILNRIFSECDDDDIRIPAPIFIDASNLVETLENPNAEEYLNILDCYLSPVETLCLGILKSQNRTYRTKVQFDFSLFKKYYFDLKDNDSLTAVSPPDQWRERILKKLSEYDIPDSNYIEKRLFSSNYRLMQDFPLFNLGSEEFSQVFITELNRRHYIKANGLDRIPPRGYRPYGTKINYSLPVDNQILSINDFIERLSLPNIPKGGRLVISFCDQ